jgi:hypothetical protein
VKSYHANLQRPAGTFDEPANRDRDRDRGRGRDIDANRDIDADADGAGSTGFKDAESQNRLRRLLALPREFCAGCGGTRQVCVVNPLLLYY